MIHDSVDNYNMGQRHLKTWPPRRCSSHPPHQPRATHSCRQKIVVGYSGGGAGGLEDESTPLSPCCKVIFHWEIRDSERESEATFFLADTFTLALSNSDFMICIEMVRRSFSSVRHNSQTSLELKLKNSTCRLHVNTRSKLCTCWMQTWILSWPSRPAVVEIFFQLWNFLHFNFNKKGPRSKSIISKFTLFYH